jgi:SAM-dependent methyltransferase
MTDSDPSFAGSIPEVYDNLLVPLIFQPYAHDLARRASSLDARTVLEVAAGTGVVTRALADATTQRTAITATDLSQPMLDRAESMGTSRPVKWQQADAMELPFAEGSFDVVICQFGVMFFPDRRRAYAEVVRTLRPGGVFLFNVWDRIENNDLSLAVHDGIGSVFPDDPPQFLRSVPFGYFDKMTILGDLDAAGFRVPAELEALEARSRAASAELAAAAFCKGPVQADIEARDPDRVNEATAAAATMIAERFGATDIDGRIRAFVITATRP